MKQNSELINKIKKDLDKSLTREEILSPKRYCYKISIHKLEKAAKYLKNSINGRLAHISVIDVGIDGFDIVYHYALDHIEKNLHLNLKVNVPREKPALPSLANITTQAVWPEREMMDFTRVEFTGNPITHHLWLPYEWPEPPEGKIKLNESDKKNEWITISPNPKNIERSTVLFGPYHPALIESVYWKLKVDGEEILDAEIKLGWNHRGIMKLFEDKSYRRALMISERICGICHISHTSAYTNAVEYIANVELPERARFLKTLLNELERIHSHLLWFAVAVDLIGFKTLFMLALKLREEVMDIFEKISGHRRTTNCIQIGGIRFD
ncbi:MAG: NADH-quinone oxidoreductase subunit C, partial [Melioribacteraceae bacterium]|nr:NADH-quinone oxidoreductase subunit C [Melioribacteraceae bacterium]